MAKLASAGFEAISIEPTRVYGIEDARRSSREGLDLDLLATEIDGTFVSAFVRATKPARRRAVRRAAAIDRRDDARGASRPKASGRRCCSPPSSGPASWASGCPGGNVAIALLANTIATGAALVALILTFGPISGAHFNPAVTLADACPGRPAVARRAALHRRAVVGALVGVGRRTLMFGEAARRRCRSTCGRRGADVQRVRRDVRPAVGDLGLSRGRAPTPCRLPSGSTSPPPTGSPRRPRSPTPP